MRKDKLNHSAENYRAVLPVLLVALFGMIAYLYINADDLSTLKIVILALGIAVVVFSTAFLTFLNFKHLKELEEMP